MNNICPNAGCGAAYNITPQHIGRKLFCKKCGASLVVAADGLQFAPGGQPAADADVAEAAFADVGDDFEPAPARRARPRGKGGAGLLGAYWDTLKGYLDVPTIIFGVGAFFLLLFMLLPQIDRASHERAKAQVAAENDRYAREVKELNEQKADQDRLKKAEEEHKKNLAKLEENEAAARYTRFARPYFYRIGDLFGFLILTVGCLAYLNPKQAPVRRIVGGVVLVVLFLWLLNNGFKLEITQAQ